jgi:hypothetical protein
VGGQNYYSDFTYPPSYVTTSPTFEMSYTGEWGDYAQSAKVIYGNGEYHMVIAWPDEINYYHSNDGGYTWSNPETVASLSEGNHVAPSMTISSNGSVVVLWVNRSPYDTKYRKIAYKIRTATGWSNLYVIYECGTLIPEIRPTTDMIIKNDIVYATWSDKEPGFGKEKIFYTSFPYDNPSLASIEEISAMEHNQPNYYAEPKLGILGNTPHAIWQKPKYLGQPSKLYHSFKTTSGWTNPLEFRNNAAFPSVTVYQNALYCTFFAGDPQYTAPIVVYRYDGTNWTEAATLDNCGGDKHPVITSSNYNLSVVLQPSYPPYEIYYYQYQNGGFTNLGTFLLGDGSLCLFPSLINGSFGRRIFLNDELCFIYTDNTVSPYRYVFKKRPLRWPPYQNIRAIAESNIPEATAYNNARRMLKDNNGLLHLAFTNGNDIYHTFHNPNDTVWSEPAWIGEGKYPALSLGSDGKLYCVWNYHGYQEFDGVPYFVEYLKMRSYNGISWSKPTKLLFHTYGTYLWGVGAPSLATYDSMAYVSFKSYHGPTFNPVPGEPYPHIVVVEGPALIYGKFPLNNPDAYTYQIIDTIIKNPNPVDTLTYRDSLVPLLISPSITVDMAGTPHILWEGDSTAMRYYSINDSIISRQIFDSVPGIRVDYPSLIANNDQVQLLWAANDSIKYRYGWANTENLSQPISIAACENPISSGQYLAWTKHDGYMSYLFYGAIPGSGIVDPIEVNYSTDIISFPQILFNPEKLNQSPSLDLIWTEYSQLDSLGYIYYINLPLADETPIYSFDMGTEIPVPILIQRDGFLTYGSDDFKTVDYDSTELIYHLALHSPHKKYRIKWSYYHQESSKIKLDFSIDDIFHHNRWVNPCEQVTQETWIPDTCLVDNEITIKVKKINGSLAVLSGFEIYERIVGGGGPQGSEAILSRPFSLERVFPNPAKGMARIRFNSPDERFVSIKLYDITGRLACNLLNDKAHTGMNEIPLRIGNLSNGIYFMEIETKGYSKVEKIILLK